jgi:hypothetical protein
MWVAAEKVWLHAWCGVAPIWIPGVPISAAP